MRVIPQIPATLEVDLNGRKFEVPTSGAQVQVPEEPDTFARVAPGAEGKLAGHERPINRRDAQS